MSEVKHEGAKRRFVTERDGHRALLGYRLTGDVMTIIHTEVPPQIGGRGVAAELMRAAVNLAVDSGYKIVPACSYAAAYLDKHSDEAARLRAHEEALLDEALDESYPASDPPSVGRSS
jgi:predicted GNAT family acetyltransferase